MIQNATLVSFSDLLTFATQHGFDWNQAHGILVPDEDSNLIPNHGINGIGRQEIEDEFVEGDCKNILLGFMFENRLEYMYLYYDK